MDTNYLSSTSANCHGKKKDNSLPTWMLLIQFCHYGQKWMFHQLWLSRITRLCVPLYTRCWLRCTILLFADLDSTQTRSCSCFPDASQMKIFMKMTEKKNASHNQIFSGSVWGILCERMREIWNWIMDSCMEEDEKEWGKRRETYSSTHCIFYLSSDSAAGWGRAHVCTLASIWLMSKRECRLSSDCCIIHCESLLLHLTIRISLQY